MMRNFISDKLLKTKILFIVFFLITTGKLFAAETNFKATTTPNNLYQGITTATFDSLSFYPKRTAPAKVEALNNSMIAAEIAAKIKQISVKPGDQVKAGTVLAKLECSDYQARLASAIAVLNQTQQQLNYETKELERAIKVAHKSSLSESEIERRQTVVNNLKFSIDANTANRDIAKNNVSRCTIRAPFKGLVVKRMANVGEIPAPGSAVLELIQLDNREVSASISLRNLVSFKNASEYKYVSQNISYPLKLRNIVEFIANNSSSQNVRFNFINRQAITGSTGRLIWKAPVLHLPAYLLSSRENNNGVFIVRDGKATFITVENAEEGRPFSVALSAKDEVILDGRHALKPNQKLKLNQSISKD